MPILDSSANAGTPLEGNPTIGVELEVEVDRALNRVDKANAVFSALNADGARVIVKSDGSLSHGFEIVSRPMGIELHKKLWMEKLSPEVRAGLASWDTETCGLHTHIPQFFNASKDASAVVAVQHPCVRNFVECLAGRDTRRWARFHTIRNKADAGRFLQGAISRGDRYLAVNSNSRHNTHEIRIFKGNTRPQSIMRAVEFAEAVWCFGDEEKSVRTEEGFLTFLKRVNATGSFRWPNLVQFIENYGQEQNRAMREVKNRFRSRLEERESEGGISPICRARAVPNRFGDLILARDGRPLENWRTTDSAGNPLPPTPPTPPLELPYLTREVRAVDLVMTPSCEEMARTLRIPLTPCEDREDGCSCCGSAEGRLVRAFTLHQSVPFIFEPEAGRWFAISEDALTRLCESAETSTRRLRSVISNRSLGSVCFDVRGQNCGKVA